MIRLDFFYYGFFDLSTKLTSSYRRVVELADVTPFTGLEEVEQSRYGGILGCLMGGEFLDGGCHVIGLIQEQFFVSCFECSPTFFRKPATLQTYEIDSADCVGIACENHERRYVLWYGRHAAHHAVFAYAGKLMHG